MTGARVFKAKKITAGKVSAPALVAKERVALRGFIEPEKGAFRVGELQGASIAGRVLIFPSSKGSTLWSMTLDSTCRYGHAPAAIINSKVDAFVVLGCVLQDIPLVQVDDFSIFDGLKNGDTVTVDADKGEIAIG